MGDPAEEAIASGTTLGGSVTGTAKGGASILGLVKGEVSAAGTAQATTQSTTTTKVPRRGMQQVIKEIGGSDFVILLDDFHYLDRAIQTQVAQQLKEAAR